MERGVMWSCGVLFDHWQLSMSLSSPHRGKREKKINPSFGCGFLSAMAWCSSSLYASRRCFVGANLGETRELPSHPKAALYGLPTQVSGTNRLLELKVWSLGHRSEASCVAFQVFEWDGARSCYHPPIQVPCYRKPWCPDHRRDDKPPRRGSVDLVMGGLR